MTTPFIGEIQLFGFDFNPRGWALCNGATLNVRQSSSLFALLGVAYGGDGVNTFQLPNFTNRSGCEQGQSPGNSRRSLGQTFGAANVALGMGQMPIHNHGVTFFSQNDPNKRTSSPNAGSALSVPTAPAALPFLPPGPALNTQFASTMFALSGNGQPHENQQPYLAVNFCIALEGAFPSFG